MRRTGGEIRMTGILQFRTDRHAIAWGMRHFQRPDDYAIVRIGTERVLLQNTPSATLAEIRRSCYEAASGLYGKMTGDSGDNERFVGGIADGAAQWIADAMVDRTHIRILTVRGM